MTLDKMIKHVEEVAKDYKRLKELKEQEPKTGHWIEKDDYLYVCSECRQYIYSETEHDLLEFHAFCGRCGAKMVEPQESEEVWTREQAIENLNDMPKKEALEMAIKALEQEPKTVIYSGDGYADGYMVYDMAECPSCGYEYEDGDKDWGLSFCPNCGQALNWERSEE